MSLFFIVCQPPEAHGKGPLRLPWASCVRKHDVSPGINYPGDRGVFAAVSNDGGDSVAPGVEPKKAMVHSLIIPGWGQLENGRKKKAALFFAVELFCIGGYVYENRQAKKDGLTEFEREAYKTDRNSFVIYWLVTKILDITDAYVDAQLAGFNVSDITPEELKKGEKEEKIEFKKNE